MSFLHRHEDLRDKAPELDVEKLPPSELALTIDAALTSAISYLRKVHLGSHAPEWGDDGIGDISRDAYYRMLRTLVYAEAVSANDNKPLPKTVEDEFLDDSRILPTLDAMLVRLKVAESIQTRLGPALGEEAATDAIRKALMQPHRLTEYHTIPLDSESSIEFAATTEIEEWWDIQSVIEEGIDAGYTDPLEWARDTNYRPPQRGVKI